MGARIVVSLAPVAISVQQAKPNYAYGQLGTMPLATNQAALVRVGLPAAIAEDAVVSSATLVFTQAGGLTGSSTVNLRRLSASFNVSKTTWNNRPSVVGSTVAVTKSNTGTTTQWSFDVTADVQAFAAGTLQNFGWQIIATAPVRFRGSSAAGGQPVLVIDYLDPGEAPEDLFPGGIVSIAKPTLSFLVAPDTTAVQVQVDADATSPFDFDSGEIASTAGQVDLNTTAYAGLGNGATTFWRARSRGGTGLTGWSAWATFSRANKGTVAITSPSTSSDDATPPIQWTFTGGTQESWRVFVTNSAGVIVVDSGRVGSTVTTWTPTTPVARIEGETVTITVRVWDNIDRVTTPGDPEYAEATRNVTLSTSAGVTNPTSITATNQGGSPVVLVTATAASAPDGWAIIRDGKRIYTIEAFPVTTFAFNDWSAAPGVTHVYRAARIVNGQVSAGGPTATITPIITGIWLVDPDDGTAAFLTGRDTGSWSATELAILHQPIAGPPIRRVAYRPPLSGSITGQLVDTPNKPASSSLAALYSFKSSPANRVLQLVLADRSIPVNVGDITVSPNPVRGLSDVSFTWWQVDDVPWTA